MWLTFTFTSLPFCFENLITKRFSITLCSYTLGGFFLASYDDSPAGVFDEVAYLSSYFMFSLANYTKATLLNWPVTNRKYLLLFSPTQLVVIAGLVWSPPTSCAYVWLNFVSFFFIIKLMNIKSQACPLSRKHVIKLGGSHSLLIILVFSNGIDCFRKIGYDKYDLLYLKAVLSTDGQQRCL